ncbi:hypothetical protein C8J57DRAFT_1569714 [Mycena rebaudengoi]|nr:hypothetical protein C8J57DRAFT_1569714 [Mycena rebaudengoi]
MQRLFFSVLTLTLGEHPKRDDFLPTLLEMIQSLGTGKTRWSIHAGTLHIRRRRRAGHKEAAALPVSEGEMKELLASAPRCADIDVCILWPLLLESPATPSSVIIAAIEAHLLPLDSGKVSYQKLPARLPEGFVERALFFVQLHSHVFWDT